MLDEVEGIPDEYLQMNGTYEMTAEQRAEWETEVRSLYDSMVRIVVKPTWAKLIDFPETLPSAVEDLIRRRQERQEPFDSVDTMILGANTYAQAKGYWPYADDQGEYGEKLNNLTKFVASSKLDDAPWGDFPAATVTRDPAATIRELKEQNGKDIWLWGSLKLMHSLLDAGVVDEVRMLVCPASRGKGTRIFDDWQDLKLVEGISFENGMVLLRYEIQK